MLKLHKTVIPQNGTCENESRDVDHTSLPASVRWSVQSPTDPRPAAETDPSLLVVEEDSYEEARLIAIRIRNASELASLSQSRRTVDLHESPTLGDKWHLVEHNCRLDGTR